MNWINIIIIGLIIYVSSGIAIMFYMREEIENHTPVNRYTFNQYAFLGGAFLGLPMGVDLFITWVKYRVKIWSRLILILAVAGFIILKAKIRKKFKR